MTDQTERANFANMTSASEIPRAAERPFGLGLVLCGIGIVVGFLLVLAGWSFMAPLESGIIAPGVVSTEFPNRTIQPLEDGIIGSVHVREGDFVKTGALLYRLNDTAMMATRNRLRAEYIESQATLARLIAERDGQRRISFPEELIAQANDPLVQRMISAQQDILEIRIKRNKGLQQALQHSTAGSSEELDMLQNQVQSLEILLTLTNEELANVRRPVADNVENRPRLLALRQQVADIQARLAEARAASSHLHRTAKESEFSLAAQMEADRVTTIEQILSVSERSRSLGERLAAAESSLRRAEIRSPVDGTVMDLRVSAAGSVVTAGQPLLNIVPRSDTLVVDASIDPRDIEQIKPGLPAQVQITALNRRSRSPVAGEVITVSADTLMDNTGGAPFYRARILLKQGHSGPKMVSLRPGMGAEVMIQTGSRTAAEFLLMPIRRSLNRAMHED